MAAAAGARGRKGIIRGRERAVNLYSIRRGSYMRPGFHWYHLLATTYGAWLYGDALGFRTRHHREHVEGDYKNPPLAGKYAASKRRSKEKLRRQKVIIPEELRPVVGRALLEKLQARGALGAGW